MLTLMLDNNIIIDHLLHREPFCHLSRLVCLLGIAGEARTCISINMLTDIFYILRKRMGSEAAQEAIQKELSFLTIIGLSDEDGQKALSARWADFEDALVSVAAYKTNADYIITRNTEDFTRSSVPAITPEELFARYEKQGVRFEEFFWSCPNLTTTEKKTGAQ